jgi:hypothetical protein
MLVGVDTGRTTTAAGLRTGTAAEGGDDTRIQRIPQEIEALLQALLQQLLNSAPAQDDGEGADTAPVARKSAGSSMPPGHQAHRFARNDVPGVQR